MPKLRSFLPTFLTIFLKAFEDYGNVCQAQVLWFKTQLHSVVTQINRPISIYPWDSRKPVPGSVNFSKWRDEDRLTVTRRTLLLLLITYSVRIGWMTNAAIAPLFHIRPSHSVGLSQGKLPCFSACSLSDELAVWHWELEGDVDSPTQCLPPLCLYFLRYALFFFPGKVEARCLPGLWPWQG